MVVVLVVGLKLAQTTLLHYQQVNEAQNDLGTIQMATCLEVVTSLIKQGRPLKDHSVEVCDSCSIWVQTGNDINPQMFYVIW